MYDSHEKIGYLSYGHSGGYGVSYFSDSEVHNCSCYRQEALPAFITSAIEVMLSFEHMPVTTRLDSEAFSYNHYLFKL